jgi:hypothetical protein
MQIALRLILACLLLIQSLPGLASARCAGMSASVSALHPPACPCCAASDDDEDSTAAVSPVACSAVTAVASCCCGQPQRDEPVAPAGLATTEQLQHFLAAMPVLIGLLVPEIKPVHNGWTLAAALPHYCGNSTQSLLCVWVM